MGRLSIEGMEELQVITTYDALDVDRFWAPDPAQFGNDVVLVNGNYSQTQFGRLQSVLPTAAGRVNGNSVVWNTDSVPHGYTSFAEGPGIPGGRVQIVDLTIGAFSSTEESPKPLVVLPGQQLVSQASDAYAEAGQFVEEINAWNCVLQEAPEVSGYRFGSLWSLIDASTPVVLEGPSEPFTRRRILWPFPLLGGGTFALNRDDVEHALAQYLIDPVGGNRLIANGLAPAGLVFGNFPIRNYSFELQRGQSWKFELGADVSSVEPLIHVSYIDFMDSGRTLLSPPTVADAPDPPVFPETP